MDKNEQKVELASAMLSLLRMRLYQAIDLGSRFEAIGAQKAGSAWLEHTSDVSAQALPMKRVGNATSIIYACAIAHRLATKAHHAATIAVQLVEILRQDFLIQGELLQGVTVNATTAGLIHFEVGDRAIAAWLDSLLTNAVPKQPLLPAVTNPMSTPERQLLIQSPAVFEVQHAHARCCSLLKLAHREALISLKNLEAVPFDWRFGRPTAISWLMTDQLYLSHSVDRGLLSQLFDAYEHLSAPSRQHTQAALLRSAQAVAQAFQVFHREHSLQGKADEEAAVTLARLGLLMVTQRVLWLLLWDGLSLCPVVEF